MSVPSLFGPDKSPGPAEEAPASPALGAGAPGASPLETRSLYRKYRPQSFGDEELVGQEPVVRTLRNAIRLGRVAHAYLFCGPRGTGKTTTARLLAKAVNCLDPDPARRPCNACASCRAIAAGNATDVIEIDAASNRGIDDIRELRERVKYAPAQLRVKFYIVDEAHQITGAAANAFLKTLEEPPDHTKFVLATTDPEELLPTIVSRCQRFDFRRIGFDDMVRRLQTVAAAERLRVEAEALAVIARHATGSLRDGLGLLDQLALYDEDGAAAESAERTITADMVRALLGVSRNDRIETLVLALADRDATKALAAVNDAVEAGEDPRQLNRQLVTYLRLLLHQRAGGSPDADEQAKKLAARFELSELADLARRFGEIDYKIKRSAYGQLPLEIALVEGVLRDNPVAGLGSPSLTSSLPVRQTAPPAAAAPPIPEEDEDRAVRPRPPTTLRDRVRGVESAPNREPTPLAPARASTIVTAGDAAGGNGKQSPPPAEGGSGPAIDLEGLVDLWPRIRQDVKALNRRIEALLTSVDPARVEGRQITLATAYPFHRDKLNSDEFRAVVEGVIGRLVGGPVQISCLLREEALRLAPPPRRIEPAALPENPPGPAIADSAVPFQPPAGNGTTPPWGPEADEQRLRAAINIFDAEEIDPDPGEDR